MFKSCERIGGQVVRGDSDEGEIIYEEETEIKLG